jgi:hypothetical protein
MSRRPGQVPILETLQAAVGFWRAQITALSPAALGLAGVAMLVWMAVPLPGGAPPPAGALPLFPIWAVLAPFLMEVARMQGVQSGLDPLAALVLVAASGLLAVGYWALLLRRAASAMGIASAAGRFSTDWARLARVFASLWFLFLILSIAALIAMFSLLGAAMGAAGIGPQDLERVQNSPEAATALLQQGLSGPSGWLVNAGGLAIAFGFAWLLARLALSGPATILEGRVSAFGAWAYTKGDALWITVIYTVLAAPAVALAVFVLATTPTPEAVQGGVDLTGVIVGNFLVILVQTLVVMPLMAGAGVYLYRGLKPANE